MEEAITMTKLFQAVAIISAVLAGIALANHVYIDGVAALLAAAIGFGLLALAGGK